MACAAPPERESAFHRHARLSPKTLLRPPASETPHGTQREQGKSGEKLPQVICFPPGGADATPQAPHKAQEGDPGGRHEEIGGVCKKGEGDMPLFSGSLLLR